jgi:outer membrane protein
MKKILYAALVILTFAFCQQTEKIGYVDNSKLINDYQEKIDIEEKIKIKITPFQKRTDSLRKVFQLDVNEPKMDILIFWEVMKLEMYYLEKKKAILRKPF